MPNTNEDSQQTRYLFFRRLPKWKTTEEASTLKQDLNDLILSRLEVGSVRLKFLLFKGRSQALVEFLSVEEAVKTMVSIEDPSSVLFDRWARPVAVSYGVARDQGLLEGRKAHDEGAVRTECVRALNEAIRTVVTEDANDRKHQRQERRRAMRLLVQDSGRSACADEGACATRDRLLLLELHALLSGRGQRRGEQDITELPVLACDSLCIKQLATAEKARAEDLLSCMHTPLHVSIRRCVTKKCVCWRSVRQPSIPCHCALLHVSRPVTEMPSSLRSFRVDDSFTSVREGAEIKAQVAQFVAKRGAIPDVFEASPRTLLLDGPRGNTCRAVMSQAVHSRAGKAHRTQGDIVVPNYVASTITALQTSEDVCTPYFGSVRALLDAEYYTHATEIRRFTWPCKEGESRDSDRLAVSGKLGVPEGRAFSLVYLDYCSRFTCGHTHIETSPRGDIEALFKYGLLARRTEFIITLCKGRGGDGDANAGVEATVEALCAQHFFVILQKGLAYSYGKMEVWAFSLEST